jgi:hypothetical protein
MAASPTLMATESNLENNTLSNHDPNIVPWDATWWERGLKPTGELWEGSSHLCPFKKWGLFGMDEMEYVKYNKTGVLNGKRESYQSYF